ncbi:MAG: preprotein translocase subunit SecA [bacterium]|nr:preprotein translocase subunit SecA [bacterium]MDZ4295952.1 preprotein translocase subunit SecA [Patescibacteria group bacterium]
MSLFTKIFGGHERIVAKLQHRVEEINALEAAMQELSATGLKERTAELKRRRQEGEELDELLADAFALVREASRRTLAKRHFDVQLLGGMVLHQGKIAEMKTGEGKTLVATLPAYLNALDGTGVHVVTVNDYLAKRDTVWMGEVYDALGLTVSCIVHENAFLYDPNAPSEEEKDKERDVVGGFKVVDSYLRPVSRKEAYQADVTYGTNNEFGFDYLRDNMVYHAGDMVQRGHHFAIVDEVDSILIDEARTPLIISMPDEDSTKLYELFTRLIPRLQENTDYNIDKKLRAVTLSDEGIEKVEKLIGFNMYQPGGVRYVHALEQALRAHALFQRDKDYVVRDGEVIIVDEFTGRLMPGRRWSEGLHQAVEAKERVSVQKESRTLATITFQNYFRLYAKLAGMTGTALTSAEEFDKVYKLDVVSIPTNRKMIRQDLSDRVYKAEAGKFKAIVEEIKERHAERQPVLVGTISIEKSERLSEFLKREGIGHEVLNAKNHEREGAIIAQAGRSGAVTVATNMAGRGVDIILGGNPPDPEEQERVRQAGGLHVIGTERHEARRIDNQLRGRSGRQGDPGSSQFFVSLEDDIMRIFGGERLKSLMDRLNVPEDLPIEHSLVSKSIESAQQKIEGHNLDIRKHVLEYDEVMNKHRQTIYARRIELLSAGTVEDDIRGCIESEVLRLTAMHASGESSEEWNTKEIFETINAIVPQEKAVQERLADLQGNVYGAREELESALRTFFETLYSERQEKFGAETMNAIAKTIMLRTLDMLWVEHLETMEHLRDAVRLRAYGQRDPLVEYKNESHRLFEQLLSSLQANVVNVLFKVAPVAQAEEGLAPRSVIASGQEAARQSRGITSAASSSNSESAAPSRSDRIGRNDPCPCGSGKKYKKCHGGLSGG